MRRCSENWIQTYAVDILDFLEPLFWHHAHGVSKALMSFKGYQARMRICGRFDSNGIDVKSDEGITWWHFASMRLIGFQQQERLQDMSLTEGKYINRESMTHAVQPSGS